MGEKAAAEALALGGAVDGEAGEEDDADRVLRESTHELGGRVASLGRAHREAEVAEHLPTRDEDEGAGGIHGLGREGMSPEPVVEERHAVMLMRNR